MLNGIKIVDVKWISPGSTVLQFNEIFPGTIGVVLCEVFGNKYKSYIGVGAGINEEVDIENIAKWGGRLPLNYACALWPDIQQDAWYKE